MMKMGHLLECRWLPTRGGRGQKLSKIADVLYFGEGYFAGMQMVADKRREGVEIVRYSLLSLGRGQKLQKIADVLNGWSLTPYNLN